jgi:hypothetical protein
MAAGGNLGRLETLARSNAVLCADDGVSSETTSPVA